MGNLRGTVRIRFYCLPVSSIYLLWQQSCTDEMKDLNSRALNSDFMNLFSPSLPLLATSCLSSSGLQGSLWLFISLGPPLWRLQPRSKTPSRHHFLGQSNFFLFFFSVHNGGWRILTGQISDFMQKKISDVRRRILNPSPGIVVFRATWCSTNSLLVEWKRNLSVFAAAKSSIPPAHQSASC